MLNTPVTHLSTYHDLRAINIARGFVSQTGGFFGADKTEMHQLELIAEEASAFIINTLKPDKDKLFEIKAKPIDSGLSFYFYSRGEPIDEDNLPVYDTNNPENSSDGLEFFLLENLSDFMEFKNNGNDGWVLIFEKRFRQFKPFQGEIFLDEIKNIDCSKEELTLSIATPKDAYSIVKLTYLTYRYTYGKSILYYRKKLQEAIESKDIIIFVAKNKNDEVVMCSTYYKILACKEIVEAGILMSKPEYRKNYALLKLFRMQEKFLIKNQENICVAYANLVTAHTKSQRLVQHYGYYPTALKLSVHDRADFIGIDTKNEDRESLLYAISVKCNLEKTTIFLPKEHHPISEKIIQNFNNITLSSDEKDVSIEDSKFQINKYKEQRYATLEVIQMGLDWQKKLKDTIKELRNDGLITIFIYIQADTALPYNFELTMKNLGLFYSGIILKTLKIWDILYTSLEGQHFDFDNVKLSDTLAIELKEYMRTLI